MPCSLSAACFFAAVDRYALELSSRLRKRMSGTSCRRMRATRAVHRPRRAGRMNGTRIALVGLVAACAWAAWPKREVVFDTHSATRQFVIRSTLARFDDAIVVLGDSIVEASTLPRSLCGHPIVNAGIGAHRPRALSARFSRSRLAANKRRWSSSRSERMMRRYPNSVEQYRSNYRALLAESGGADAAHRHRGDTAARSRTGRSEKGQCRGDRQL